MIPLGDDRLEYLSQKLGISSLFLFAVPVKEYTLWYTQGKIYVSLQCLPQD